MDVQPQKNERKVGAFRWTPKAQKAAILLAQGYTREEAATSEGVKVAESTVYRWLNHPEFSREVDRLTYLTGLAARVERLRLSMRIARNLSNQTKPTSKDLLEWMKFIQSETDGAKLDLTALFGADAPAADNGSAGDKPDDQGERLAG